MLRRKLQERQKGDITWPLTPEKLICRINVGPLTKQRIPKPSCQTKQIVLGMVLHRITGMEFCFHLLLALLRP